MEIDTLSAAYVGEDRIKLSLDPDTAPTVGLPVAVLVDYSACEPDGASLPVELIVQGPTHESYAEHTFRRFRPGRVVFVPKEAGPHLVLLREHHHNRWLGRLVLTVGGDTREV